MKKFAASIPRKMFWSDKVPNKLRCPFCKTKLESEYHTYLMAVRSNIGDDPFIIGNDYGRFCSNCPIVVLDPQGFNQEIAHLSDLDDYRDVSSVSVAVFGIVDVEAIPPEKAHLSIGDEKNPIPLVKFVESIERPPDMEKPGGKGRLSGNQRRRRQKYRG